MVLTKNITDTNIEHGNYSVFVFYFDKLLAFQKQLIPIISQSHLIKLKSPNILEMLPPNNDFKVICDKIYLMLLLN